MAPSAVDEPAEAAEAAVAAVWAGLHVSAISLRRRADRWAACEAHLTSVLPPAVRGRLKMVEGTDAAAAVGGASPGEASVAAFELATGSVVYRGWPLVEVADARRCFPSMPASATDAEAWIFYESACRRAWRPDRARLYVDFFHRHLTAGDVGAGLSHLRVAEATHAEGVPWQLVLEDDARLTPHAVPALLDEIALLSVLNVAWDMIYLHSADYGRHPEPRVHPRSRLLVAGHRKVCHAYALSASGAAKIARSGFRQCLFAFDDFLPALHAGHPREDIVALPCVRRARGEVACSGEGACGGAGLDGAAVNTGGGVSAGAARSRCVGRNGGAAECAGGGGVGFVALTFADGARMLLLPEVAAGEGGRTPLDSDSKAGTGSCVLLGDAGVDVAQGQGGAEGGAEGGVEAAIAAASASATLLEPSAAAASSAVAVCTPSTSEASEPPPAVDFQAFLEEAEAEAEAEAAGAAGARGVGLARSARQCADDLRRQLLARGYARLRLPADSRAVAALRRAEDAAAAFFALPAECRKRCTGGGGRQGELLLWSCGYSQWPHRHHWHVVCGAFDAQMWPGNVGPTAAEPHATRADDHLAPAEAGTGASASLELPSHHSELRAALLEAEVVLRAATLACVGGGVLRDGGALLAACRAVPRGEDPSVLDAFLYSPRAEFPACADGAAPEVHMSDHLDPGVLTVKRRADPSRPGAKSELQISAAIRLVANAQRGLLALRGSDVAGLEVWDEQAGAWVAIEAQAAPSDLLVLAGEQLRDLSGGAIPAVRHRVLAPETTGAERRSLAYEFRLPDAVAARLRA